MTGRINFTPEARQQLHHLDEWITEKASADTARRFVAAILAHIHGPDAMNAHQCVSAGQPQNANTDRPQPLNVARFPWYY